MDIILKDGKGQGSTKVNLASNIFGLPMNEHLLHTVAKAYRANARQGTHATKTKAMVSGGGKKPFKQKGTGEARQGSSRSPLNPGGGVSHGPQPRDYNEKINKAIKQQALAVVLSNRFKTGNISLVTTFGLSSYSTKSISKVVATFGGKKSLLIDAEGNDYLFKSCRNIYGVNSVSAKDVNAYDVLDSENVILTQAALVALNARFGEVI
ncbi:MAG: 50S ribosomal protein L4 [Proteobacteria bacterium]|nr:50S ribosomal protein L4 [Pseudomonadota bacterium]